MKKRKLVRQRDHSDCGAACLASIAAHYQLFISVNRIRQYAGTDQSGTSMSGLMAAAGRLHFQSRAVRATAMSLPSIPLPAIAHFVQDNGSHHFVVLYRAEKKQLTYMDPATAKMVRVAPAVFQKKWTGVLLLLMPSEDLQVGGGRLSVMAQFLGLLRPHRGMMFQAFLGALVYTLMGLSTAVYVQKLVDFVIPDNNLALLQTLGVLMSVIWVFQGAIGYIRSLIVLRTGQQLDAALVMGYFRHLFALPQQFFDTIRIGEIMSRINDAVKIRLFINDTAMSMVLNGLIISFSISMMFIYNWKLAAGMMMTLPLYTAMFMISNRINKKWERRLMEHAAAMETQVLESLDSMATVRRFGMEAFVLEKIENRFVALMRTVFRTGVAGNRLSTITESVTRLFTITLLWAGTYFVLRQRLSAGELLSFYALTGYFTAPAMALIAGNKSMQDALIAADRLFDILDLETTARQTGMKVHPLIAGDIRFRQISFRHGSRHPLFSGLELQIRKHEITAIVGESGSGKSTLVNLLQQIYPLQAGEIYIGDTDIRYADSAALKKMIGVVPQQIDVFSGTVISNIALGAEEPDMKKIVQLSGLLGLDDFIRSLPAGFETVLSAQGSDLSGGQKQRLAIARALYRDPDILILDEATAALDAASEAKVKEALQWFRGQQKTALVIAHRKSMIELCDRILVLQQGRLVADLSNAEFLADENVYSRQVFSG